MSKSLKENAAAIITALIMLLLVGNYLSFVVPQNEKRINDYNRSMLDEFDKQLNGTLKDYASQVDLIDLRNSIRRDAWSVKPDDLAKTGDQVPAKLLDDLKNDRSRILDNVPDNIIIQSIHIDSVRNDPGTVQLQTTIRYKFSSYTDSAFHINESSRVVKDLCTVHDTVTVTKSELKKRLCGAIQFPYWAIYVPGEKKIFLNNNIDAQELDSIDVSSAKLGVLTFKFSDKHFYKQSAVVEGTDYSLELIGAIPQIQFESKAKLVNERVTSVWILIVLLLFLSIPLVKPLIASKKERMSQFDLLSVTTGIGVFVLILVSFFLSNYCSGRHEKMIESNLIKMNDSIKTSYIGEFMEYKKAMNSLATYLTDSSRCVETIHRPLHDIDSFKQYRPLETNIQNFFRFNADGDIVKDLYTKGYKVIRRNYNSRDYMKTLREKQYDFLITGVYSKYDNKYKMVYIRKLPDSSFVGFAYTPKFNNGFSPDKSSGFMICDKEGKVIFHSDESKILNENVLSNSDKSLKLEQIFHGMEAESIFDLSYNGKECVFCAQKITNVSSYPLYLITYQDKSFANSLHTYTLVNGFFLSLAYGLGITFLMLVYSVFFQLGEIPVISRVHVYWLFPDNSREKEYKLLRKINFLFFALFLLLFILGKKDILYYSFLTGINVAFFNFVLLNQRAFELKFSSKKARIYITLLLILILGSGYALPYSLYIHGYHALALSLSVTGHFLFLYILKKDTKKEGIPSEQVKSVESKRKAYVNFFSSVICYHYLLIPTIIVISIFSNEVNRVHNYSHSYELQQSGQAGKQDETAIKAKPYEMFLSSVPFVSRPSNEQLRNYDFDNFVPIKESDAFDIALIDLNDLKASVFLFVGMIALILLIKRMVNFYSGRFFFFELSEAFRVGFFQNQNQFTNYKIILPPYSDEDLEALERYEKFGDHEKEALRQYGWLKAISGMVIPNEVKIRLIMNDNFVRYQKEYEAAWNELTDEEKFVMNDFAVDHFVNYKNRNVLISLMEKGFIIADPLTGRLRVMNYGFRNYVVHVAADDPRLSGPEDGEATKGVFSKWRLPIIIVATSAFVLMMYLSKESFNHVLVVGGSLLSAVGLIAKFLDSYKS
ncbi:MAG: hypothetical protein ACJ77K_07790 [Bacteroidia bacterium]